jgi:hypothetical protein
MSINLLAPEEISIELSTVKNDLSDLFGKIIDVQDIQSSVATQIGAGQVTVLGTFVVADWLTAGTTEINGSNITTGSITLSTVNGGSGSIQSADYSAGSAGWLINSAGNAEFNNVTVRGNLDACTVGSGKTLTVAGGISVTGNITLTGSSSILLYGTYSNVRLYDDSDRKRMELDVGKLMWYETDESSPAIDIDGLNNRIDLYGGNVTLHSSYDPYLSNITVKLYGLTGNIECADIECADISCDDVTFNSGKSISGCYTVGCSYINVINITASGDISCDDISCNDITLNSTGDIIMTGGSIYMNGYELYESGGDLYWRGTKLN